MAKPNIARLKAKEAAIERKNPESKPASERRLEAQISKAIGKPYKGKR